MPDYIIHPHHRNRNRQKSQWEIVEADERAVFDRSITFNWLIGDVGWGLHLINNSASILGKSALSAGPVRKLGIAKFVASNKPVKWHGYPADICRRQSDAPPETVKALWLELKLIKAPKLRKLSRGQPCTL